MHGVRYAANSPVCGICPTKLTLDFADPSNHSHSEIGASFMCCSAADLQPARRGLCGRLAGIEDVFGLEDEVGHLVTDYDGADVGRGDGFLTGTVQSDAAITGIEQDGDLASGGDILFAFRDGVGQTIAGLEQFEHSVGSDLLEGALLARGGKRSDLACEMKAPSGLLVALSARVMPPVDGVTRPSL